LWHLFRVQPSLQPCLQRQRGHENMKICGIAVSSKLESVMEFIRVYNTQFTQYCPSCHFLDSRAFFPQTEISSMSRAGILCSVPDLFWQYSLHGAEKKRFHLAWPEFLLPRHCHHKFEQRTV